MRLFRRSKPSRLFILGLDGSPLPLLQSLMAQGKLPNLARVFQQGSAVEMNSSLPDVSAVAWTSVNTGKNPGKHGIYGFVDRKPQTNSLEVMTSRHVKAKTIWELVSDAGKRAVAINVPLSFPPQRINGVVISDFLAPTLDKAVYPTTLLPTLQQLGYRIDTDPWVARQSLDKFLEDFKTTAEKRTEAVLSLMDREEWDFFMVVYMETDRLHHFMWNYYADNDPTWGPRFVEAYQLIDQLAGKIFERLDADDELIIMSDHGFTVLRKEVYLNAWLEQEGYLRFQPDVERSLAGMDPRTLAYSLDPGRIYVNLKGRGPEGTVPQSDFGRILDEIENKVASLRDPDSGKPIVKDIYRADQIYEGPYRNMAPDMLLMPHDGFDIKGSFETVEVMASGPLVGMHKYDNATLFVRNHRITVDHASVRDVMPTACTLLGLDCPPDVDGQVVIAS